MYIDFCCERGGTERNINCGLGELEVEGREKREDRRIPKVAKTHTAGKVKLFEAINFVKCLARHIKRASKQGLLKKGGEMGIKGHREVGSSWIP